MTQVIGQQAGALRELRGGKGTKESEKMMKDAFGTQNNQT